MFLYNLLLQHLSYCFISRAGEVTEIYYEANNIILYQIKVSTTKLARPLLKDRQPFLIVFFSQNYSFEFLIQSEKITEFQLADFQMGYIKWVVKRICHIIENFLFK